jgi:hypothetical protein
MQSQCSDARWNAIAMPKHRAVFAQALYSDDNRGPRVGRRGGVLSARALSFSMDAVA